MTQPDRSKRRDEEKKATRLGIYERMRAAMGAPSAIDEFEAELRWLERANDRQQRATSDDERRAQDLRAQALSSAVTWSSRAEAAGFTLGGDLYVIAAEFQRYIETGEVPTS